MLSEPPLVGREEELGRLNEILQQMTSGSGGLVLLSGEAGIGKTRLATEFEKKAEVSGCKVLFGSCLPSARIPYLVFLDALNDLFVKASEKKISRTSKFVRSAKKAAPDLISAVPLIGNTLQASAVLLQKYKGEVEEPSKEHVLFRTLELLRTESAKKPIIIHLDDMQWADSMSIGMLHFLARNCKAMKVLLLGTYRSEEVLNKDGGIHPFLESIRIMKREGLVEELHLRALAEKELDQVISRMLEKPVSELILERIFKESGGSPLFAVETVRLLESIGSFVLKDGRWTIPGPLESIIPSSVKEVILRRVERTSREERKALDYASVIGLTFSPVLLANALRNDQLLLLENLEHLESDHQLVREIDTGYMFTHEKVRKFTYDSISNLRRKEIHRSVGRIIEKELPNDALYPDLALHFYSADDAPKAMKYSSLAGEFLMKREAVAEAIPHFERALEIGPKVEGFEASRLSATEGLGDAYYGMGNFEAAAKLFEGILQTSPVGNKKATVLRKLAECWSPLKMGEGNKTKAMQLIEEARAVEGIEPNELGMIANMLTVFNALEGNWDESIKQGNIAVESYREAKNTIGLAIQLMINSDVHISTGEIEMALGLLREAEELNRSMNNPFVQSEIDNHYGLAYSHKGQVVDANRHYQAFAETCKKFGYDSALSVVNFKKAVLMTMIGEQEAALELARNSLEFADKIGSNYLRLGAIAMIAHLSYKMNDFTGCEKYAADASEIGGKFDKSMKSPNIGMARVAQAELSMIKKDWDAVDRSFQEAIAIFKVCYTGRMMEALASAWFGDALLIQYRADAAVVHYSNAREIFKKLGNEAQLIRYERIMKSIAR